MKYDEYLKQLKNKKEAAGKKERLASVGGFLANAVRSWGKLGNDNAIYERLKKSANRDVSKLKSDFTTKQRFEKDLLAHDISKQKYNITQKKEERDQELHPIKKEAQSLGNLIAKNQEKRNKEKHPLEIKNTQNYIAKNILLSKQTKENLRVKKDENDPTNKIALALQAKFRKQGKDIPGNGTLKDFKIYQQQGGTLRLPTKMIQGTFEDPDKPGKELVKAFDINQLPHNHTIGSKLEKTLKLPDGRIVSRSGKEISENIKASSEPKKITNYKDFASPDARKRARIFISDRNTQRNQEFKDLKLRVLDAPEIFSMANKALENKIAGEALAIALGDFAGLGGGTKTDRDIAMWKGSNDLMNYGERLFTHLIDNEEITEKDHAQVMSFMNEFLKMIGGKVKRWEDESAHEFRETMDQSINPHDSKEFISSKYSLPKLYNYIDEYQNKSALQDNKQKQPDKSPDDIPQGFKPTGMNISSNKDIKEGVPLQVEGKTYFKGKDGMLYEKG